MDLNLTVEMAPAVRMKMLDGDAATIMDMGAKVYLLSEDPDTPCVMEFGFGFGMTTTEEDDRSRESGMDMDVKMSFPDTEAWILEPTEMYMSIETFEPGEFGGTEMTSDWDME